MRTAATVPAPSAPIVAPQVDASIIHTNRSDHEGRLRSSL